jgi:hypothetical protein
LTGGSANQYKVHLAKLAFALDAVPSKVAAKVNQYPPIVFDNIPNALFQGDEGSVLSQQFESDERPTTLSSSKSGFETLPLARIDKQRLANDLAALGRLLTRKRAPMKETSHVPE